MNLGRWGVAFAQKNSMKNKVCGPEGRLHESEAGSTGRGMKNKVCGAKRCLHENEAGSTGRDMRSKKWYEKYSLWARKMLA